LKKIKTTLLLIFGLLSVKAFSKTLNEKENINVGVYIEDVFNINYSQGSYEIVFFIWVNSNKEIYNIEKDIDILGSSEVRFDLPYDKKMQNGLFHSERKVTAKILNKFDVNNFPFDEVNLHLNIEFVKELSSQIKVVFDSKKSRLKPDYIGPDRNEFISKGSVNIENYQSNFGNLDLGQKASYNQLKIDISMNRDEWNIFTKLFIILFIASILASSSILLPLNRSEEKFSIIVGALFTSIGNKYFTDDFLPMTSNFNLSDRIHMITFVFITLIAMFAIIEQRYKIQLSRRLDFTIFGSLLLCYTFLVFIA
jgi:hypothetical protein